VIRDEASAGRWVADLLEHGIGGYEAPLVAALMAAWQADEGAEVARLDADFLASRESAELRAETAQMGFSMRRLLRDLRDDSLAPVLALVDALPEVAFPTVWAGIAARWQIDPDAALCAYLWSWAENQVMAALKAVPSARPPASACWPGWAAHRRGRRRGPAAARGPLVQLHAGLRDRLRPPRNPVFTSFQILNHEKQALRVGIGGPVGSGKTALTLALCQALREQIDMAVVTNDIYTAEDAKFLVNHSALAPERIIGVETGGCPHRDPRGRLDQPRSGRPPRARLPPSS
jgi:hypothetical protein